MIDDSQIIIDAMRERNITVSAKVNIIHNTYNDKPLFEKREIRTI